jgi:hypothetical protein
MGSGVASSFLLLSCEIIFSMDVYNEDLGFFFFFKSPVQFSSMVEIS